MDMNEVRELMRLNGWTQVELAKKLDMSEAGVSRWLSGEREPAGPARILMRQWLESARAAPRTRRKEAVAS